MEDFAELEEEFPFEEAEGAAALPVDPFLEAVLLDGIPTEAPADAVLLLLEAQRVFAAVVRDALDALEAPVSLLPVYEGAAYAAPEACSVIVSAPSANIIRNGRFLLRTVPVTLAFRTVREVPLEAARSVFSALLAKLPPVPAGLFMNAKFAAEGSAIRVNSVLPGGETSGVDSTGRVLSAVFNVCLGIPMPYQTL